MSNQQWDDYLRFPCGCEMGSTTGSAGENVFRFGPCQPDCRLWEYVQQEARRQGKPISYGATEPSTSRDET